MTRKISLVGNSIGGAAAAAVVDDVERPDMSGTKAKTGLIANTRRSQARNDPEIISVDPPMPVQSQRRTFDRPRTSD